MQRTRRAVFALIVGLTVAPNWSLANFSAGVGYWHSIVFGGRSSVPAGYYNLCMRGSSVCRQTTRGRMPVDRTGAVRFSEAVAATLRSVNLSVNRAIKAAPDPDDKWRVGPVSGDCEDYALTKKLKLIRAGWPSSALLIALGRTYGGTEHAVLIARTDHGDLVLDNLTSTVRPWSPGLYHWSKVQSPTDTWTWYRL